MWPLRSQHFGYCQSSHWPDQILTISKSSLSGPGVGGQPAGGLSEATNEILLPGAAARWSAVAVGGATAGAKATEQSGDECPPQPALPPMNNKGSKNGRQVLGTALDSVTFIGRIESSVPFDREISGTRYSQSYIGYRRTMKCASCHGIWCVNSRARS